MGGPSPRFVRDSPPSGSKAPRGGLGRGGGVGRVGWGALRVGQLGVEGAGWHKALVVSFWGGGLRLPPVAIPLSIPSP